MKKETLVIGGDFKPDETPIALKVTPRLKRSEPYIPPVSFYMDEPKLYKVRGQTGKHFVRRFVQQ